MYNGQNEYVPYMQRTKRSLNDHRTGKGWVYDETVDFILGGSPQNWTILGVISKHSRI